MKTKYFALALAPALVLTIATSADARFGGGHGSENGERSGAMHQRLENVERSVEKLTNGVQISVTATDSEAVAQIQERHANGPRHQRDEVTHTVSNTSNGVLITVTSDDAEMVAKMHERADNPGQFKGRGGRGGEGKGFGQNVDKAITNLSNGVQITLTSDDADVVTKLQEREVREPKNDEITHSRVNITNGVEITITTTNEDLVERIQNRAEKGGKGKRGGRRGFKHQNS